ncbi:hypothetical protein SLEP1_g19219 [Rubroshorea leprosula]|nr:hypothetical protein SLEP1_g19219 [Rubroshorea leprosula]
MKSHQRLGVPNSSLIADLFGDDGENHGRHRKIARGTGGIKDWIQGIPSSSSTKHGIQQDGTNFLSHPMVFPGSQTCSMCFSDKLDENQIKQIEDAQCRILLGQVKFSVFNFWPRMTRILFYKRWEELLQIHRNQEEIFIPSIRARKSKAKEDKKRKEDEYDENVLSYVDTLLDLQLPDEKRKLDERQMMSLCAECLDGGTDTTATTLQWIMANLVKYGDVQENLFMEFKRVVGDRKEVVVGEDELHKMPYLKEVILEGLRRHPPGHFVLPHGVIEDVVLNGFLVPRNGTELLDITGNKEIKMMPFGAGRRFCPGYSLATLHLEYFVANLVWCFEWKAVQGDDIDLSEKEEFTVVMKFPLWARIYPRTK